MVDMKSGWRESYQVRGDTECHRQGEGYERTLVLGAWDPDNPARTARAQIRVDRYPANSYAHIDVWVPATGWQYVTSAPAEDWWEAMPGYTRGQTAHADRDTMNLVDDLVARLVEIGI